MPLLTTGAGKFPAIGGGGGLMLDGITTGIKAAYSTRKLLTAYAGSALRARNTSSHTEQDIGFSSGVLDTSSLTTFSGGSDCVVVTWYDQSGNGKDLTQAEATAPFIVGGGTGGVRVINSTRPAPYFSPLKLLSNATLTQNPVNTMYVDMVLNAVTATRGTTVSGSVANNFDISFASGTPTPSFEGADFALIATATSALTTTGSVLELQYNSSTGLYTFWIDGATAGSATLGSYTFAGGGVFQLGMDASGNGNDNQIGELVMYDQVGSFASRAAVQANQKAYWGTP